MVIHIVHCENVFTRTTLTVVAPCGGSCRSCGSRGRSIHPQHHPIGVIQTSSGPCRDLPILSSRVERTVEVSLWNVRAAVPIRLTGAAEKIVSCINCCSARCSAATSVTRPSWLRSGRPPGRLRRADRRRLCCDGERLRTRIAVSGQRAFLETSGDSLRWRAKNRTISWSICSRGHSLTLPPRSVECLTVHSTSNSSLSFFSSCPKRGW